METVVTGSPLGPNLFMYMYAGSFLAGNHFVFIVLERIIHYRESVSTG